MNNKDRYLKALNSLSVTSITPNKSVDEWQMIEGLVADYIRVHQKEAQEFLYGTREARMAQKKTTASNTSGTMRLALSLPPELYFLLKRYVQDLFSNKKKLQTFMKKFPGFTIPEKI